MSDFSQIGLTINDQSPQINLNHRTPNADRLKHISLFLLSSYRVQQNNWEGETIMKCEHLGRRVLHICAALKVSPLYFYCAIFG